MAEDIPQTGFGNWRVFDRPLSQVFEAAAQWRTVVEPIEKPWLIWHVSDRWTQLQQRLVQSAGWTPLIGRDTRAGLPTVLPGSVFIDFNGYFGFPFMMPHFVVEFMFLFCRSKLAFWHSDLLCRAETMERLARMFDGLQPGWTAAVYDMQGRRNLFFPKRHRYWELVGCTTVEASRNQFETGAGWFMNFRSHPNCKDPGERKRREGYFWDHGAGILYWKRRYGGHVLDIPRKWVEEGHCTAIGNKNYFLSLGSKRNKNLSRDLDANYSIDAVAARLGIAHLLDR